MRGLVLLVAAALVAGPARGAPCDAEARALFLQRGLDGAIAVQDVRTGRVLTEQAVGVPPPVLPLSTVKLLLAAADWEHPGAVVAYPSDDPHDLIAYGGDSAGRRLALALKHALGDAGLLRQLAVFGFPSCRPGQIADCTSISAADDAARWADMLSIGEAYIHITPLGLARFLRAAGADGVVDGRRMMSAATAAKLRAAMLDTVRVGTATSVRDRLSGLGGIGGKTGSGPAGAQPSDGIFAGLVFDRQGAARWAFVTYVRRGGLGGGAAAGVSADLAAVLLGEPQSSSASNAKLASQCSPM